MFNLLIADDERLTRQELQEYLCRSDLNIGHVYGVSNGEEALELMKDHKVDILLCDVKRPRMDGIELATIVRRFYPECKILFLSGYSTKEFLKSAILLKVESYIEKPVDLLEIGGVLSDVIAKLEAERDKKQNEELLVSGLMETFPLVKQEITLALLSPETNAKSLKKRYSRLYFSWEEESRFTAVCIHPIMKRSFRLKWLRIPSDCHRTILAFCLNRIQNIP